MLLIEMVRNALSIKVVARFLQADAEDADDLEFEDWVDQVHDGGSEKVPNPNPDTRNQHPQVMFSTALHTKSFQDKAFKDYERWREAQLAKRAAPEKEEPKPAGKPEKARVFSSVASDKEVDDVLVKHREEFKKLTSSMKVKVESYKKAPKKTMPLSTFEKLSEAEQMLFVAGHEVGAYFQDKVVKDKVEHKRLMTKWRQASGDPNIYGLHGLLEKMGVPGSYPKDEREDKDLTKALKKGAGDKKLEAMVKQMSAFEQAFFKHLGVKELTVYRDVDGQGLDGQPRGTEAKIGCRPASSFTFDPTMTGTFGNHTLTFKVPVNQILASPLTNPDFGSPLAKREGNGGATGESEMILMGASTLAGKMTR